MNTSRTMIIAVLLLSAVGLVSCGKQDTGTPAGKESSVSKAASNMGNSVGEAAKNTTEAAKSAGNAIKEAAQDTGQAISDSALTVKVKSALMADSKLKSLQISVDTIDGVVTLTGQVDSQEDSRAAAQVAGAVEGVKSLTNNLTVKDG